MLLAEDTVAEGAVVEDTVVGDTVVENDGDEEDEVGDNGGKDTVDEDSGVGDDEEDGDDSDKLLDDQLIAQIRGLAEETGRITGDIEGGDAMEVETLAEKLISFTKRVSQTVGKSEGISEIARANLNELLKEGSKFGVDDSRWG